MVQRLTEDFFDWLTLGLLLAFMAAIAAFDDSSINITASASTADAKHIKFEKVAEDSCMIGAVLVTVIKLEASCPVDKKAMYVVDAVFAKDGTVPVRLRKITRSANAKLTLGADDNVFDVTVTDGDKGLSVKAERVKKNG